jgi:hypothetical protein
MFVAMARYNWARRSAHSTSHDSIRSRAQTNRIVNLGLEVLTAAIMRTTVSWEVTPCSPTEVHQRFGGMYCLFLQCRKVSQAKIKQYSYIRLTCLILRSWRWRLYFLPKRRWTTRLHCVHSQTTVRIRHKESGLWLACKHRGREVTFCNEQTSSSHATVHCEAALTQTGVKWKLHSWRF